MQCNDPSNRLLSSSLPVSLCARRFDGDVRRSEGLKWLWRESVLRRHCVAVERGLRSDLAVAPLLLLVSGQLAASARTQTNQLIRSQRRNTETQAVSE